MKTYYQTDANCKYIPTPEEIAQKAAEIRQNWSETEANKRAVIGHKEAQVTRVTAFSADGRAI